MLVKKFLVTKKCLSNIFGHKKNVWSKFWLKKCLVKKINWAQRKDEEGLTQGEVDTRPPPPLPQEYIIGLNCVGLLLVLFDEIACKISYP